MIKRKDIAAELNKLMLEYAAKLDASVELVQKECDKEDFEAYRDGVGKIMGCMLFEVINPLYEKYPELTPKEMKRQ